MKRRKARVECDAELNGRIRGVLHNALAGKPVLRGDSLQDLVNRHCPDIYDICRSQGFKFIADTDPKYLEKSPPELYFDVVRDRRHLN